MGYQFTFNKDKDQIELGDTGLVVAKKQDGTMFYPDVDPTIGAKVALHVFNGINRVHDFRFGDGENIAKGLSNGDFSEPKKQNLVHDSHSLVFNEYTSTIRVKETNHMLIKKGKDGWVFDGDGGAPEVLAQQTFLRFHANKAKVNEMDGNQLLEALTTKPDQKLEKDFGM